MRRHQAFRACSKQPSRPYLRHSWPGIVPRSFSPAPSCFFSQSRRVRFQHQPYQYTPPPPEPFRFGPSRKTRFVRSMAWATLFGVAGALALIYSKVKIFRAQSRIRRDSPTDVRLAAAMRDHFDADATIQALLADSEFEEIFPFATTPELMEEMSRADPRNIHHLLYTAGRGIRGIFPRAFFNPSRAMLVMVVGYGFGNDDVYGSLHNGAVMAPVQESIELMAQVWFPAETPYKLSSLFVSFAARLPSDCVCAITVVPASTVKDLASLVDEHPRMWPDGFDPTDWDVRVNTLVATVSVPSGHPLDRSTDALVAAMGQYDVEKSEDWPPNPPSLRESIKADEVGDVT